jgi:hypothetical protein
MSDFNSIRLINEAIRAEWQIKSNSTDLLAIAEVGCFSLQISLSNGNAIGWIEVSARVGGGVGLWRSRNEMGVQLDEVLAGMIEFLHGTGKAVHDAVGKSDSN